MKKDSKLIGELLNDYKPSIDMFSDEDERTSKIKQIIFSKLNETERRILLLYVHFQSAKKTADFLGVSSSLIYKYISRSKRKVNDNL